MSFDFSQLRILVVDDQMLVRSLISQIMRTIGCRPDSVSQATDGNNALRVLEIRTFDLIVCDFQMDPINGVDLLKEVRCARTPNPSNIPFVFLSGHPERSTIMRAAQFHADGFIIKPPTPSDIEKNIESAMTRKRPAIDPFHYLGIPTGSEYDLRNFIAPSIPPASLDLNLLLERFHKDEPLDHVLPGQVLARDILAADGRALIARGVKISKTQLDILRKCQAQYGISTLPIAHLPADQMIMYHEVYGL
jgi:CheY-like chemotaxis protein